MLEKRRPLHIVSAFACEQGLSLGLLAVDGKCNEIIAIPALIASLAIKGHIVTIDAMGSQRAIAQQIIDQRGDYLLAMQAQSAESRPSGQN